MKISSSAYFAVESLVRLAVYDAKRPCPVELLAHSVGCSVSFTEQLMAELCVAGLVKGTWRRHRSYYLNRPLQRITVAEVFGAFGEPHALAELGGADLLWQSLNGYILLFLEGVSLADLAPAADEASPDHAGHFPALRKGRIGRRLRHRPRDAAERRAPEALAEKRLRQP